MLVLNARYSPIEEEKADRHPCSASHPEAMIVAGIDQTDACAAPRWSKPAYPSSRPWS